ncbi:aldehyde dehydrogenase family protein [Celeribacter neptunius]|uniref:Aldehyde dehydrogenase (Acceptor) n=1 Tax=Celeribacter neptunius TaxID=588602 RepID=A0A1I3XWX4_9RHOB|nr:aldehyde dehydrogenase family protein [Celeribacter neptunius]SFK24044.1 aldehyde dehydrogenase (acceptor) [Celeribacter neptunius]
MTDIKDLIQTPTGQMLINGVWVKSASEETIAVEDPSNGQEISVIAAAGKEDVNRAVAAARTALESAAWSRMRPIDRGRLLEDIARKIEEHAQELALLESYDNGMPVGMAMMVNLPASAEIFRYMGGWCSKLGGKTVPVSGDGRLFHAYTQRAPVGVVGAITPWNYPLAMASWKIAMALAAGCTVVLKPAEMTSLSALRLVQLIHEAGVPEGVVNVVTGYGQSAGQAMAEHEGIDKIAFTGSTATGKKIATAALGNMKRVGLELGGKSPSIICADADLSQAIPGAALACFFNSGQICFAATRLYVHKSVYEPVVEGLAQVAESLPMGNGRVETNMLGPLVSKAQQDRVMSYVEKGKAEGADLVCGGETAGDEGYYVKPTIFGNTTADMSIVKEEIFGPILSVAAFEDMDEVVKEANNSAYGLAANLWTNDLRTAHITANKLNAGSVWVNCHGIVDPSMPFGGFKESGWGREVAEEGVSLYTETKSVVIALEDAQFG